MFKKIATLIALVILLSTLPPIPSMATTIGPAYFTVRLQGQYRPLAGYIVPFTIKFYDQEVTQFNIKTLAPVATISTIDNTLTNFLQDMQARQVWFRTNVAPKDRDYWVTIYSPNNLVNAKHILNSNAVVDMGTLLAGDARDITRESLIIDAMDYFDFINAYDSNPSMPNWNPNADFDKNGYIEIADFGLLYANFGKSSPQTVS